MSSSTRFLASSSTLLPPSRPPALGASRPAGPPASAATPPPPGEPVRPSTLDEGDFEQGVSAGTKAARAASPSPAPMVSADVRAALTGALRAELSHIGLFGTYSERTLETARRNAVEQTAQSTGLSPAALTFPSLSALAETLGASALSLPDAGKAHLEGLRIEAEAVGVHCQALAAAPLENLPAESLPSVALQLVKGYQGELHGLLLNASSSHLPASVASAALRDAFLTAVERAVVERRGELGALAVPLEAWVDGWRAAERGPLDVFARHAVRSVDLSLPDAQVQERLGHALATVRLEAENRPGGSGVDGRGPRGVAIDALQTIRGAASPGVQAWIDDQQDPRPALSEHLLAKAQATLAGLDLSRGDKEVSSSLAQAMVAQISAARAHPAAEVLSNEETTVIALHAFLDAFSAAKPACFGVVAEQLQKLHNPLAER